MPAQEKEIPSFSVSPEARDYLLYSSFIGQSEHTPSAQHIGYSGLDKIQSYRFNSHGYRGPEFSQKVELLCSGDSQTFGVGLPENAIWPTIVSKDLNISSYANLALPGASVQSIVIDILHFFRKFGAPKNLLVMFPDLARFLFYSDPSSLVSRDKRAHAGPTNVQLRGFFKKQTNYSKKPHEIENVITMEQCYMVSFQMINILEDICDAMDVNLHWSIWDTNEDLDLIYKLKMQDASYFRHFFLNDSPNWSKNLNAKSMEFIKNYKIVKCHYEFLADNENIFQFATDKYPHHDGLHRHLHVADEFKNLIK